MQNYVFMHVWRREILNVDYFQVFYNMASYIKYK